MNVLDHFAIPYKGLGVGLHELHFQVDNDFFASFEEPVLDNGNFEVILHLDKRIDHSILTFEVMGHTVTTCDRCTAEIKLPVNGEYTLHLKFSESEVEEEEIVYLHPDTSIVNVAKYVYDVIGVSVPMTNIYDCENDPYKNCNEQVLNRLGPQADDEQISNDEMPSPWDGLKGMNFDN